MGYLGPRDVQSAIQAQQFRRSDLDNRVVNEAIAQSVQEFPPAISAGPFYAQFVRGPILPPYGTKERDRVLRLFHRNEYNLLWQGAIAGIIKRIASTPYTLDGPPDKAEYFRTVLQTAQFGMGWEYFLSRFLEDYFTQDYGGMVEIIAEGDPNGPLKSRVVKLAALDVGRAYVTGNPYFPFLYYGLYTNALHRMHASRIWRFVDQPNPDERFLGIGYCALSRAIAAVNREIFMNRFIETRLDDKPKPGLALSKGMTKEQREKVWKEYFNDQSADERPAWGKTIWFDSVNIDNAVDVKFIPFAQTPELFDFEKYKSLNVNEIALAIGIDRQELWELSGRGMGSGAQSAVLAEKARGKTIGYVYQAVERFINQRVLPWDCEFKFKIKDDSEAQIRSTIDQALSTTVQGLVQNGILQSQEARAYLANASESFNDVLTNTNGQIEYSDVPLQALDPRDANVVTLQDDNSVDVNQPQTQNPNQVQASDDTRQVTQNTNVQTPQTASDFQQQQKGFRSHGQRKWWFNQLNQQSRVVDHPIIFNGSRHSEPRLTPYRQAVGRMMEKDWPQNTNQFNDKVKLLGRQFRGPKGELERYVLEGMKDITPVASIDQFLGKNKIGEIAKPLTSDQIGAALGEFNKYRAVKSNGNGHHTVSEAVTKEIETFSGCIILDLSNDLEITQLQAMLRDMYPAIEWSDPQSFHITLVYTPDTPDPEQVIDCLPDQFDQIPVILGPVSTPFEDHGDGTPIVLEVSPNDLLRAIQAGLAASVLSKGIPLSEYSLPSQWHPHVTLGYVPAGVHFDADTADISIAHSGFIDTTGKGIHFSVGHAGVDDDQVIYAVQAESQKITKQQCNYEPISRHLGRQCATCIHYLQNGACDLVEGEIDSRAYCKYYEETSRNRDPYDVLPYEDRIQIGTVKSIGSTTNDYRKKFVGLFERGVRETIDETVFEDELLDLLTQQGTRAYLDGLRQGGIYELDESDREQIESFVISQIDYISGLADQIYSEDLPADVARNRAEMWINKSIYPLYYAGIHKSNPNGMYIWVYGDTVDHCDDCHRLSGQVHRMADWMDNGLMPGDSELDCKGFQCDCDLRPTRLGERGAF